MNLLIQGFEITYSVYEMQTTKLDFIIDTFTRVVRS